MFWSRIRCISTGRRFISLLRSLPLPQRQRAPAVSWTWGPGEGGGLGHGDNILKLPHLFLLSKRKPQKRHLKKMSAQGLQSRNGGPWTRDASKGTAGQGYPSPWLQLLLQPAAYCLCKVCCGEGSSFLSKAFMITFDWTWKVTLRFLTRSWPAQEEATASSY